MPTRNVVLTEHQEKLIEELVTQGRYQNASEVLREGLRLVELEHQIFAEKLNRLRAAVSAGFESIERGDYLEFSDVDELTQYLYDLSEEIIAGEPDEP